MGFSIVDVLNLKLLAKGKKSILKCFIKLQRQKQKLINFVIFKPCCQILNLHLSRIYK